MLKEYINFYCYGFITSQLNTGNSIYLLEDEYITLSPLLITDIKNKYNKVFVTVRKPDITKDKVGFDPAKTLVLLTSNGYRENIKKHLNRVQWDPGRTQDLQKLNDFRTIRVGIHKSNYEKYNSSIVSIEDITDECKQLAKKVEKNENITYQVLP